MTSLSDLVVGDPVVIHGNGLRYAERERRTIAKATKTQITLDDGSRWMIKTGLERMRRTIFCQPIRIYPCGHTIARPVDDGDAP